MTPNPQTLVDHCVRELRSVSSRGGSQGYGLEARCAIVVRMDNVEGAPVEYVTTSPAPGVGDPLHYDSFIHTICDLYGRRFPS